MDWKARYARPRRLPGGQSPTALLPRALDEGVAYVPGAPFFPACGGE